MTPQELIDRHPEEWRSAIDHPFLTGIADGTLPTAAFDAWLVQDHRFVTDLIDFQRRLLAVAPVPARAVLAAGVTALGPELGWMEEHCRRRGIDVASPPHPLTVEYRSHLEGLLASGAPAALTGLWTLERAYLDAWRGAAPGAPEFREFVEHWTTPEFESYVSGLAAAMAMAGADEAAFLATARLEARFWEVGWAT